MAITINAPRDSSTLSNYNNWRTTHTTTTFDLLFDEQRLQGNVTHKLKSITDSETDEIILDSSHVLVKDVKVDNAKVEWEMLPRVEPFGSPLKIKLSKGLPKDHSIEVSIDLATTAACTAIQWMTPAQTSNKKHPYMFSQCQAIHARSIFPCQDTPDVKGTFEFNITSPLPVIASGLPAESNPTTTDSKPQLYKFRQDIPIPSYLYALASGDIVTAPIGKHSVVATSPDKLKDCQWEFEAHMDKYLSSIESLVFPYVWGQYNILILPPSFPFGGMENPIFTFATPTVVSGDRQNVDVIAHELAHSWSGNLVTSASWEHFWLNEGWTTYLERRLQAAVHGDDAWRDFSAIIGWKALQDAVAQYGADHEFTKLVPGLKGMDPDDAFSTVPYEKGFTFLFHIENLIGKANFDRFIPHYFTTWRGKSLDSYDFKATLLGFFTSEPAIAAKLDTIDWDTWFYTPGLPPKPHFNTKLVDGCYALAEKWKGFTETPPRHDFGPGRDDVKDWSANQVVVFLEAVLGFDHPLPAVHANYMGYFYGLKDTQNVEVSSRYCQIAMQSGDVSIKDKVVELLGQVGRMKFVRPLYRGLMRMDLDKAVETFEKNKDFYHPICRAMIVKDLFGTKK